MRVPLEEFEDLVAKALDGLPEEFARLLDNVAVMVEDEPSEDDLASVDMDGDLAGDPAQEGAGELFGLYQGVPLSERDSYYSFLPDRVVIYRGPILRWCQTRREVIHEVRDTVVHELGHHFGLAEHELPY